MNSADIKVGEQIRVSMPTQPHEHKQGDKGVIIGAPIVLVKFADGHLERFVCHEIEKEKEK